MGAQIAVQGLRLLLPLRHQSVEIVGAVRGLRVLDETRVWELAIGINPVHSIVVQFLGESKPNLFDLVARELVFPREIARVVLRGPAITGTPLNRDLRGLKLLQS